MNKVIVVEKKTRDYKKIHSTASNEEKEKRQQKSRQNDNRSNNILIYMIIGILIALITVVFCILYINKCFELSRVNFKINQVEKEIETLNSKKQRLKLQISQHKSLSRVERIAKTELGMIEAENIEYIAMGQQEGPDIENKPPVDSTNKFRLSRLGSKVISWLQGLTEVEAGTLEDD